MLEANAMDFDDLLVRTVNATELFEEVRERWRRTFRHVLVDEYQDTNHAQYRLLQLLAGEHRNLMVVGDDAQSIYSFRHADVRNILDFERDFPEAALVKLEQNYRSTEVILNAANAVVERNRERRPKELWTEEEGGEPVRLSELTDEHEEARWVAAEIERLGEEQGLGRSDVAVFYRTNAMSRVLEDTLNRFDVPYQVIGGTKFYERAEIKDAVAYLSLLVNPADLVSFTRIVNSPRRGIGNTTQGRLASHANTTGLPIWDVVERVEEVPGLSGAAIKSVGRFYEIMATLRERADEEAPVAALLEAVLNESGYLEALAADRPVEAEGRGENLPSRFVDEIPVELTARHSTAAQSLGTSWGTPTADAVDPVQPLDPGPALELQTGDDVVHASFGDGVVTGVEPGGVIIVRFSGDGTERKLMADYAPIRKR